MLSFLIGKFGKQTNKNQQTLALRVAITIRNNVKYQAWHRVDVQ